MTLVLQRQASHHGATIGTLSRESERLCYTLEDVVREQPAQPVSTWKIAGTTAIPAGRYEVRLTFSQRFQRILPILLDVPGFTGIRIHAGNRPEDSEGCILVGLDIGDNNASVEQSRVAVEKVMTAIQRASARGPVYLDVRNPMPSETVLA